MKSRENYGDVELDTLTPNPSLLKGEDRLKEENEALTKALFAAFGLHKRTMELIMQWGKDMAQNLAVILGMDGFDLAAVWAGMNIAYQVENDPFCVKLLERRFPNVSRYTDIRNIPNGLLPRVDIITGGFPCQHFSVAGNRRGADDDRALWPEMLRIIQDTKPTWVIGENVPGIVSMELDNIIDDLADAGYETQTLDIPACAVGAPHIRKRIWILSYSNENSKPGSTFNAGKKGIHADSNSIRQQRPGNAVTTEHTEKAESRQTYRAINDSDWERYIKSGVCRGNNGIPSGMDRLRSLGNAIVPQIAYELLRFIQQTEIEL